MGVPLVDLKLQHQVLMPEMREAFDRVITTGKLILGEEVETFERELAAWCGVKHAIGVSSGTDALLIAMMALGIGPGDEVITTPMTFFATAGCAARLGAIPVFVDVDPNTFNLDASQVGGAVTKKTKAILPVHLYGQAADMDPIMAVAKAHKIPVIEDVAQALGAKYKDKLAGTIGDCGCLSFYPTKNLPTVGDGGAVITNDDALADRIRELRIHGSLDGRTYHHIGGNFRLDALQAAILTIKLESLTAWNLARRALAKRYDVLLEPLPCGAPFVAPESYHVYGVYTVRVFGGQRDLLMHHLIAENIGCRVYYPIPLHLQPCFAYLKHGPDSFLAAEQAANEVLSLPMYPELTRPQQDEVIGAIADFFEGN